MNISENQSSKSNRRSFLKKAFATTATTIALSGENLLSTTKNSIAGESDKEKEIPWFRRVTRWGQTNISELDPIRYDIDWWRKHWKNTQIQGIIVNAGGIVAFYPTRVPYHYKAQYLQDRDLFGDLCRAAHQDGLVVLARMDSNRTHEELYKAHPDWFTFDADGNPYMAGDLYFPCINSPYYNEYIPSILTEIATLYHPEGFTDNRWWGSHRDSFEGPGGICFCENCKKSFKTKTGSDLPRVKNWDDPVYRQWIKWNYARRVEIWDLNNRITKAAGGPTCLWVGMNSGIIERQSMHFRDYKAICSRAEIIMLDHQARGDVPDFQQNADTGKRIHGLLGWDKLVPEATAMYQTAQPTFRLSAKVEPEVKLWMFEGFAGGLQPWWHQIGAYHEDRRMYHTVEPVNLWHRANEEFLINRTPIGTIGVVWSQENHDFYGRDESEILVDLPYRGITRSLVRARIPYLPVHADHIDRDSSKFSLLVLPNFGSMTTSQVSSVRRFVEKGGSLFATGESSLYNEEGELLNDYALGDLFGAHVASRPVKRDTAHFNRNVHTYLRLTPELRSQVYGPLTGTEPAIDGERHAVLKGFELTDILLFGGSLKLLLTDKNAEVIMSFIPEVPGTPVENVWMREPKTDIPGLILNTLSNGSRIAFMPADIDRRFALYNFPDHGNLLKNIIRWSSKNDIPLSVEGAGLLDCNMYKQPGRLILHITNLTSAGYHPVEEAIPIGPLTVKVKLTSDVRGEYINLLVAGQRIPAVVKDGWSHFRISSVLYHEVLVII